MYTPVNPSLLYKTGVEGGQSYIGLFLWWYILLHEYPQLQIGAMLQPKTEYSFFFSMKSFVTGTH